MAGLSAAPYVTPARWKARLSDHYLEGRRAVKRLSGAALLASLCLCILLRRGSAAGKSLLSSVNLIICVLERKQARLNKARTDETRDLLPFFWPTPNQEVGQEVEV